MHALAHQLKTLLRDLYSCQTTFSNSSLNISIGYKKLIIKIKAY